MSETLIIQSYYLLPTRILDDYELKLIVASHNCIKERAKELGYDYRLYLTKDLWNLLSPLMRFEDYIQILHKEFDNVIFDEIKIYTIERGFMDGYQNVFHIDLDSFIDTASLYHIVNHNSLISVPWTEFHNSPSFRRQMVATEIHKRTTKFPIDQSSRALGEYNISIVGFKDRYVFYEFKNDFYTNIGFIHGVEIPDDLRRYIITFFPFQIGLYNFVYERKNSINNPISFDDTYLQKLSNEGYAIVSTKWDYYHFGGANKYSNECKQLVEQYA